LLVHSEHHHAPGIHLLKEGSDGRHRNYRK
jgi:hypothetical protein